MVVMQIYTCLHLPIAGDSNHNGCIFNIHPIIHPPIVDALAIQIITLKFHQTSNSKDLSSFIQWDDYTCKIKINISVWFRPICEISKSNQIITIWFNFKKFESVGLISSAKLMLTPTRFLQNNLQMFS